MPDYLGVANWDDLDWAFNPPAYIQGELLVGYEVLKQRLHAETEKLLMPTAFQLVVERLIWFYMEMKYREQHAMGTPEGYQTPGHQGALFERWTACNNALLKAIKDYKDAERAALGAKARQALAAALRSMPEAYRADAAIRLTEALEEAGL